MEYVKHVSKLKLEEPENDKQMNTLVNMIVFENEIPEDAKEIAAKAGLKIYTFDEVVAEGKKVLEAKEVPIVEPSRDDCMMLCYTSGTTGMPKGVKMTHKMLVTQGYAGWSRQQKQFSLSKEDVYMSYLPAAHSFEQFTFSYALIFGIACGCYGQNVQKIVEDCQILKPTLFPSVPRLLNRLYEQLSQAPGDVKPVLGGRIRVIQTGSAPITPEVLSFYATRFDCAVVEGYGLSETMGGTCITLPADEIKGVVGGPVQNTKVKLRDIPDMEYMTTDDPPRGELLFKGPGVMEGYFKDPEKTADAFENGWFKSGDVGMIMPNGGIRLIDRVKNIFKLSQGEYIAPEKLENVFIKSKFVFQAFVYGDSLRNYVVAFLVIDPEESPKWAAANNKDPATLTEDPEFKTIVYNDLIKVSDEFHLNSLEKPKQIKLLKFPFSPDGNELLTPTSKLKRSLAKTYFKEDIQELYQLPELTWK